MPSKQLFVMLVSVVAHLEVYLVCMAQFCALGCEHTSAALWHEVAK